MCLVFGIWYLCLLVFGICWYLVFRALTLFTPSNVISLSALVIQLYCTEHFYCEFLVAQNQNLKKVFGATIPYYTELFCAMKPCFGIWHNDSIFGILYLVFGIWYSVFGNRCLGTVLTTSYNFPLKMSQVTKMGYKDMRGAMEEIIGEKKSQETDEEILQFYHQCE